ncbi:MAG: hypothetical protein OEY49_12705 [Candidatus Heimdallarchaeota archaeon]|nr:hypothetical protein [Candidatus Heimdallarchaeota archaeon]
MKLIRIFLILLLFTPSSVSTQIPSQSEEDDETYFGWYWGSAGILSVLFDLLSANVGDSNFKGELTNLINRGLDGLWENRLMIDNGSKIASWSKIENGSIYPGMKYGVTGIIKTFLRAYTLLNNETYLNWIDESFQQLIRESDHTSQYLSWPYNYENIQNNTGIVVNDINFGGLGIIDTILDYYNKTNNIELLSYAISIAEWLYKASFISSGESLYQLLPWYSIDFTTTEIQTSYLTGMAGTIPVFSRLSLATSNTTWINWAQNISTWYIDHQEQNGSWKFDPQDPTSFYYTSFENGVLGIIVALSIGKSLGIELDLSQTIDNGLLWLKNQIIMNHTHLSIPIFTGANFYRNGYLRGLLGIIDVFSEYPMYKDFSLELLEMFLETNTYTFSKKGKTCIGMYSIDDNEPFLDLSFADGVSGLIHILIKFYTKGLIEKAKMDNYAKKYLETLIVFMNVDNLWPRQVPINQFIRNNLFIYFSSAVMMTIMLYILKIKKKS